MYELEIVIRRTAMPFRVTGIQAEARAKEIIESFLAAWGIPTPDGLRDSARSTFVDRLAEAGDYRHDEADFVIAVRRSS